MLGASFDSLNGVAWAINACDHPAHGNQYWIPEEQARHHLGRCATCDQFYHLGDHDEGGLLYYNSAFPAWSKHAKTSKKHQIVLNEMARRVSEDISRAGEILKQAQRIRNNEKARAKRKAEREANQRQGLGDELQDQMAPEEQATDRG